MNAATAFKWRHFGAEIILLCVGWYLRYSLSYRDVEEMMRERSLPDDHATIYRWVQRYVPELVKRCGSHLKATTDSWRVDETSFKVKRIWVYLCPGNGFSLVIQYVLGMFVNLFVQFPDTLPV